MPGAGVLRGSKRGGAVCTVHRRFPGKGKILLKAIKKKKYSGSIYNTGVNGSQIFFACRSLVMPTNNNLTEEG